MENIRPLVVRRRSLSNVFRPLYHRKPRLDAVLHNVDLKPDCSARCRPRHGLWNPRHRSQHDRFSQLVLCPGGPHGIQSPSRVRDGRLSQGPAPLSTRPTRVYRRKDNNSHVRRRLSSRPRMHATPHPVDIADNHRNHDGATNLATWSFGAGRGRDFGGHDPVAVLGYELFAESEKAGECFHGREGEGHAGVDPGHSVGSGGAGLPAASASKHRLMSVPTASSNSLAGPPPSKTASATSAPPNSSPSAKSTSSAPGSRASPSVPPSSAPSSPSSSTQQPAAFYHRNVCFQAWRFSMCSGSR